ncbi:MAG: hypothetical protein WKF54_07190 [Nocardioidaceae bacterium]
MKTSHLAMAAAGVLLPLSVACSSSKDIAGSDPTTTQSTPAPSDETTSSSPPTTPITTPPDQGDLLEGTGFSVEIPVGWMDITASLAGTNPRLDVAMGEANPSGFRTNFNVVNRTSTVGTIESDGAALRRQAASELRSLTHTSVEPLSDRVVDGEDAIGQTSTFVSSGTRVTFLQYFTIHDGRVYPVTMTSATENRESASTQLDEILDTWVWSGQ